jgi:hypothetical protein
MSYLPLLMFAPSAIVPRHGMSVGSFVKRAPRIRYKAALGAKRAFRFCLNGLTCK